MSEGGGEFAAAVARRLDEVRKRIAAACATAGKQADAVQILAVTKGFGPEAIGAALEAGLSDIGENYLQEAQAKFAAAAWPERPVKRHFIGHVQRNKARRIGASFDVVQTVDDVETAVLLGQGARDRGKPLEVLVQVNVTGDRRAGIAPAECERFVRELADRAGLRARGVMAVGPVDASSSVAAFERASDALRAVQTVVPDADVLSMGMTGDLEAAIAAGSTMVRIGTALFGARPPKDGTGRAQLG